MYDIVCFLRGSCHFCIRRRIRYRIRRRMSKIRYCMSKIQYSIPYIRYRIRHRIKCTISYVFWGVLAILYTTSYTISYTTSYVKYTISYTKETISYTIHTISYTTSHKMCDIVGFFRGSCHFYIRRRIRYRIKKYDIVYDMQLLVAIIRYRITISYASSLLYDIARQNRKKHTM
jgi:hypothetical protein